MGNSVNTTLSKDEDKFFAGNALMGRKLSRDPSLRGRMMDIKVTLPRKPLNRGSKAKPTSYSCRLTASSAGAVLMGRETNKDEISMITADIASQYEEAVGGKLNRLVISDPRACQLLLVPQPQFQRWWIVPARQPFSRHSGTCQVIGDRNAIGSPKTIRAGDFLRLGSVGLLVTETHDGTEHIALTENELQELAVDREGLPEELFEGEASTLYSEQLYRIRKNFETSNTADSQNRVKLDLDEINTLGIGENNFRGSFSAGTLPAASPANGMAEEDVMSAQLQPMQCYMCFEGEEDEESNPLVAPCDCKGSTKYVHVECLQAWHSSKEANRPCIISNKKGAQVCGVCKAPYKTHLRLSNGDFVPLLPPRIKPPFISFTVCTRHQHQEELFSTRFHLSYSTLIGRSGSLSSQRPLMIGRSQNSDMVLDYRTVSTHHAAVNFVNGTFNILDLRSSNGSFLYVREPLTIRWGESVRLRWGKGSITLRPPVSIRGCLPVVRLSNPSTPVSRESMKNDPDPSMIEDLLRQLAVALPTQQLALMAALAEHVMKEQGDGKISSRLINDLRRGRSGIESSFAGNDSELVRIRHLAYSTLRMANSSVVTDLCENSEAVNGPAIERDGGRYENRSAQSDASPAQ
mmetsp:Transcript_3966/g.6050  ORF Transcript_3966/g.6050 Transcript_3966/m.6050 type:complete len:633 (-) Transcript_3966:167-2065(-)|eukprot:CAMPEP_0171458072 /NCGR_PEP_ID=MMETSP0945-20130129/3893_1 /TAXON_ID=109269 /ORGANISM="Vaucheria litorea, Strain CCMP2940" /LENGTH=632 /DNA_ID=CAMNT_0011983799 /DNA_START=80 /DNA_END=1978 /DNA_ORIENTATION=-